jgi:glycosyltransferase involved in cell wall biosynthesis
LQEKYNKEVKYEMLLPSIKFGDFVFDSNKICDKETMRIAYLGSLLEKDYPELLYLFVDGIYNKGIKFNLTLMGRFKNVSEGQIWYEKFKSSPFSDFITYIHNPSELEKSNAISAVDFLVVFRKPEPLQEYTFPTRITEMLSYGKVVVVNNFGDFKLYFQDKENCIMVDPNEIEGSIQSIIECRKGDSYQSISNGGTRLLNGPFNAKSKAKELLQIFN